MPAQKPTLLSELVLKSVTESLVSTLSRTAAKVAEDMADELMRDPAFRLELQALTRAAFTKALTALSESTESGQ